MFCYVVFEKLYETLCNRWNTHLREIQGIFITVNIFTKKKLHEVIKQNFNNNEEILDISISGHRYLI